MFVGAKFIDCLKDEIFMKIAKKYRALKKGVALGRRYQIDRVLSVSELSIVYTGYDRFQKKRCIIKEFFPGQLVLRDLDKKTVLIRLPSLKEKYTCAQENFNNEARVLKAISHPNIVRYIDDFVENNTIYLVTEFYRGKTLEQYIEKEKNIAVGAFLKQIFLPVIAALEKLHRMGMIHRDLKPNNIIITNKNLPVIIDFGSAVNYLQPDKKNIFVTPGFSPLELYSETSLQGPYSDIYSLVATLYYYLTGKSPLEVKRRIIEDRIEPVGKYNEIISPLFRWIVMKNLAVDYKKRFTSLKWLKIFIRLEILLLGRK
jgi:serine/threonine protein kinase